MTTMSRPARQCSKASAAPRRVVGPMMCQRCQNEASVHLTEPIDGQQRELHLCRPVPGRRVWPCPNRRPTWRSTRSSRA